MSEIEVTDFDGVISNYDRHASEIRFNPAFTSLIKGDRVAIATNQGGCALHSSVSHAYPSPAFVAQRLIAGVAMLQRHGVNVSHIYACVYHSKASRELIVAAARDLRQWLSEAKIPHTIYTTERARKPNPFMLRAARATVYYGDSPEDKLAADAAGVRFVLVKRFL